MQTPRHDRRRVAISAVLALAAWASLWAALAAPSPARAAGGVAGHRIVIDPGHGGSDPGSTACPGVLEKDATLQIALRLRDLLGAAGATPLLTRESDVTRSNEERYRYANAAGGEALVSVHLNGSTDATRNGTLGLYGKRTKDLALTQTLHRRLAADLGVADLGVTNFASGVLLKSAMPATMQETVFISNPDECRRLTDGTGTRQQQIAQALFDGLAAWFA